jgi:hypothetical protein
MLSHTMGRVILIFICETLFAGNIAALTGNEWRQLSLPSQQAYVIGVTDTWNLLESVRLESIPLAMEKEPQEAPSIITHLMNCLNEMTYGQGVAIVEKYMRDNPAEWHKSMAFLIWNAAHEACTSTEKKGN